MTTMRTFFDVSDEDIVLDVLIPTPPRAEAVVEDDIVGELSAPTMLGLIEAVPGVIELVPLPGVVASSPASQALVPRPRAKGRGTRRAVFAAFGAMVLIGGLGLSHRAQQPVVPVPMSAAPIEPATAPVRSSSHGLRERADRAFAGGRELEALRLYDRVLAQDLGSVDDRLIENLLACFGKKRTQPLAATLIVRYQLTAARPALDKLMREGRTYGTRVGARYTLEKLRTERRPV